MQRVESNLIHKPSSVEEPPNSASDRFLMGLTDLLIVHHEKFFRFRWLLTGSMYYVSKATFMPQRLAHITRAADVT